MILDRAVESSTSATGAGYNSHCSVGRRLLLPATEKQSTLQIVMSRLRKWLCIGSGIESTYHVMCSRILEMFGCKRPVYFAFLDSHMGHHIMLLPWFIFGPLWPHALLMAWRLLWTSWTMVCLLDGLPQPLLWFCDQDCRQKGQSQFEFLGLINFNALVVWNLAG